MIQATVAIYPLGQPDDTAIRLAIEELRAPGARVTVRSMQTEIVGSEDAIFGALRSAFDAAATRGGVVMTATVSNACPVAADQSAPPVGDPQPTP